MDTFGRDVDDALPIAVDDALSIAVDVLSKLPSSSARTVTFSPKKKGRTKTTTRSRKEKNDENAADDGTAFARFLNGRFFDVEKVSSSASFVLIVKRE